MMNLAVSERVSVKGELATIRWVGSLEGRAGDWIGLEWDNPTRGKHSGEVDGIKYFAVKHEGYTLPINSIRNA